MSDVSNAKQNFEVKTIDNTSFLIFRLFLFSEIDFMAGKLNPQAIIAIKQLVTVIAKM